MPCLAYRKVLTSTCFYYLPTPSFQLTNQIFFGENGLQTGPLGKGAVDEGRLMQSGGTLVFWGCLLVVGIGLLRFLARARRGKKEECRHARPVVSILRGLPPGGGFLVCLEGFRDSSWFIVKFWVFTFFFLGSTYHFHQFEGPMCFLLYLCKTNRTLVK